jgi:hypothetical protein
MCEQTASLDRVRVKIRAVLAQRRVVGHHTLKIGGRRHSPRISFGAFRLEVTPVESGQ